MKCLQHPSYCYCVPQIPHRKGTRRKGAFICGTGKNTPF